MRLPAEGSGGPPGGGGSSAGCEAWDVLKIGEIQRVSIPSRGLPERERQGMG